MANPTSPVAPVMAGMLAFFGLIFTFFGLILVIDDYTFILSWLFLIAGFLLMGGGIQMFIQYQRDVNRQKKDLREMVLEAQKITVSAGPGKNEEPVLLAKWDYPLEEWKSYSKKEIKFRKREALFLAILILIVGPYILYDNKGETGSLIFLLGLGIAIIYGSIRLILYNSIYEKNKNTSQASALIGPASIILNGKHYVLKNEWIWLGKVEITEGNPSIIEFTIHWETKSGVTNEQIRVPVPNGRMDEALRIKQYFSR